jgi:hypothetical protein
LTRAVKTRNGLISTVRRILAKVTYNLSATLHTLDNVKRRRFYGWFSLLLLSFQVLAGCGGGALPRLGSAGEALLIDQIGYNNLPASQLWVGFNSAVAFQKVKNAEASQQVVYIYGVVVVDAQQPLGFHLDPNTTGFWPGGIPELVQPIRTVSQNVPQWAYQGVVFFVRVSQSR